MEAKLAHLLPRPLLEDTVRSWLKEDAPNFDIGGCVVGDGEEEAVLLCKSPGVLAGIPFVNAIFAQLDCNIEWLESEGEILQPVCAVAHVTGSARALLLGERVALNCLARVSGIASVARKLSTIASTAGWAGEVAGTRKTTPGFRLAEKYGLLVGGISTHRYDLSSMVMLKDNHIWSAGSITNAVKTARRLAGFSTKVEVETRSLEEATEAASAGADIVMLDNFDPQELHQVAAELRTNHPTIIIEASGGITEQTIHQFLGPNIDVVSLSATTQGYSVVDFSLKITKDGKVPGRKTRPSMN